MRRTLPAAAVGGLALKVAPRDADAADDGRLRSLAEDDRLDALRRYEVLDTPPEEAFDDLVELAAELCGAPVSLMTLVDSDRVFHKAAAGADPGDIPREESFCTHAIADDELMVVPDAAADPRFAANPNVTGGLGIRFYAGAPLVTPEGAAIGSLCIIDHHPRELTPARERALRALSRAVVAQLELRRQNERLRALDRLKDEFVAVVAHDLRTPLTSIRGYVDMLLAGDAGPLTDTQERFLEVVHRNSDRLERLAGDLLLLARSEAGELELDLRPTDLATVVRDAAEAARPAAEAEGITLDVAIEDVAPVRADRERLGQMLDNLVSNAVKFTPAGGRVTLSVGPSPAGATIDPADTGPGIPADELPLLFERFFRARGATEAGVPGTGLGLTIAKTIAEGHGGTIAAESRGGEGARFRVTLPLAG
jgi:signal transduction histidine kinase